MAVASEYVKNNNWLTKPLQVKKIKMFAIQVFRDT